MESALRRNPKSKILEKGYINIYSELNLKERRQVLYKKRYKSENPKWDDSLIYLTNKFRALCSENAIVLDAGCGNGNYVIDENRESIKWAVGVDTSEEYTKKNICLDEVKIGNLEKLPFAQGEFDVVISLWVLEHLADPNKVFAEIHRVLKPNGIFMFATPNLNYLPIKLIYLIKSVKVNHILNKILFGRGAEEIFPAYYRANSLEKIKEMSSGLFNIEELKLNADVSYSSFDEFSYRISAATTKLPVMFSKYLFPHIIGILSKK